MTDAKTSTYKDYLSYHAILLAGFAMLSAGLLMFGNFATETEITKMQELDLTQSISQVIPPQLHDNNLLDDQLSLTYKQQDYHIYLAKLQDQVKAVAFEILGSGYAGEIRLILGLNDKGEILGVRVLQHAETPGLGDKIEEKKDPWILGFNGLSLQKVPESEWSVKKDNGRFDQFSGATITPRAVVNAIKMGLDFYQANQVDILAKSTDTTPEIQAATENTQVANHEK